MIQLGRTGVIIDQDEVGPLRAAYARNRCVLLPGLLDASLLDFLARRLERQPWVRKIHRGIGAEDVLDDAVALSALNFVANTPAFLNLVRRVSGRDEVRLFRGRVYRLTPGSADYDSWHSDVVDGEPPRLVGMSINLGKRACAGGLLQMRSAHSEEIVHQIANRGWGDATLFEISGELKHRVSAVTGSVPRVACAGWFTADGEDYFESLRRAAIMQRRDSAEDASRSLRGLQEACRTASDNRDDSRAP